MSINLVDPSVTTTNVWIVQTGDKLEALSACCNRNINYNWDRGVWHCKECTLRIRTPEPTKWRGASNLYLPTDPTGADKEWMAEFREWVSFWVGRPEDQFKFEITWTRSGRT